MCVFNLLWYHCNTLSLESKAQIAFVIFLFLFHQIVTYLQFLKMVVVRFNQQSKVL